MEIEKLMQEENLHVQRLAELVKSSLNEERMLSARLFEVEQDSKLSMGQNLADKVAVFGGSWIFISVFFIVLASWIFMNTNLFSSNPFDPYPFILLNLLLSCIAAIQAPIIMMSQNRRDEKDRRRARSDFMINMKAELEVRSLHAKIDLLISEQMTSLFKVQQAQLDLLTKIELKM
ncbi:MAG: DUF1003 domain-containing protein, partial [Proteobacteria bacterium]|nr:DUF1003 domain-containing protein [Pseudomonadota bacterium]